MWRTTLQQTRTAVLYFGLVLSHLVGKGSCAAVTVLAQPGQRVSLPCPYRYEAAAPVPQLSVQWRSPHGELRCHYVKHKHFRNCTSGYVITYNPGNITLTVLYVTTADFGAHVCSVSKKHEFSDYSVELLRAPESVTSAPNDGWTQSGPVWILVLLRMLGLFVCM